MDCNKAIELNNDDAELYLQRFRVHVFLANEKEALADFEKGFELSPDRADAVMEQFEKGFKDWSDETMNSSK